MRSNCRSATIEVSIRVRPTTSRTTTRTATAPTYGEHRELLEFGLKEYLELQAYARELGIDFFSTAFDFASADFLEALDMPAYKIASGDLKNIPLLQARGHVRQAA